ncbi:hypothetical protein J6590_042999 [Homalodisca vitripennis]|nr:hypothetical protein J6590_042999 [Homalodisca vitripennis]
MRATQPSVSGFYQVATAIWCRRGGGKIGSGARTDPQSESNARPDTYCLLLNFF